MSPWLLLLLALWHCDLRHERITEAAGEKTESSSKKDLVVASSGLDFAFRSKGDQHPAHTWCTPLSRQSLAEEAQKDGDFDARSMEMRSMQKTKQAQCFVLWRLWSLVGAVLGQDLHAPHQLCYGWIDAQRQQPPTRVECRWLGPETKESKEEINYKPEKTRERRSQRQRKGERQQYDTTSEQVAHASARLVQCQGRSHLGSDATKIASVNQTSRIICRSARFDCNAACILSGWIAARAANQGGQDQEDIAYGFATTHWTDDQSQKRAGCLERSQETTCGSMEAPRGEPGQNYQCAAHAIQESRPRLRSLRRRFDTAIPGSAHIHPADHTAEQTSRRRFASFECGRCNDEWRHCNGAYQCRRRGEWRCFGSSATTASPKLAISLCSFFDARKGKITKKNKGRTDSPTSQKPDGFILGRCGEWPTVQSVPTERDRCRTLRFLSCVETCEHSLEGETDGMRRLHSERYDWKLLEEPKSPDNRQPKLCMDTLTAIQHGDHHSVTYEPDFLDQWQARVNAFILQLEVGTDDWEPPPGLEQRHNGECDALYFEYDNERAEQHEHMDAEPLIIIDDWQDMLDFLTATGDEESDDFSLEMYGLKMNDIGVRTATSGLTFDEIRAVIRRTWADHIESGIVYLHLVRPQEDEAANSLQVIVEIVEDDFNIPPNFAPILHRIHYHSDDTTVTQTMYHEDRVTSRDIIRGTVAALCGDEGSPQCNVHIEKRIAIPHRFHDLRRGSMVEIFVHDDISEDFFLMQRARPSRSPHLKPVRLVGLRGLTAMIHLDTTMQFSQQLEEHWPFHHKAHSDLEGIHEVTDPPTFSRQEPTPMFILEFKDDRFTQEHEDDVLMLTTLIFEGSASLPKKERLRVRWMPNRMSRDNILDYYRTTWYCRRPTMLCHVFHNGPYWPQGDQTIKHIDFGDHVRLQLRSSGPTFCDMEHSERISRGRRMLESSSEEERQLAESIGDEESLSVQYRSRSRSRHSASADSQSLLQVHASTSAKILQDVTNTWRDPNSGQEAVQPMKLGKPELTPPVAKPLPDLHALPGNSIDLGNQAVDNGSNAPVRQTISIANLEGCRVHETPIEMGQHFADQFEKLCSSQELVTDFHPELQEQFPPVAREWANRYPHIADSAQNHTFIYTDGAAHGGFEQEQYKSAAYAVVLFAEDDQGQGRHLVGWKGGFVETDPKHPSYYGAQAKDAINAEQSAILQALLIVYNRRSLGRHIICFDNQAAGFGADGIWKTNHESALAKTIRMLVYMMQQMNIDVHFQHVKAHSNHPQNDIVDQCAKNVNLGKVAPNGMHGGCEILTPDNLHKFILWRGAGQIFPVINDHKMQWIHQEQAAGPSERIKLVPAQQATTVAEQASTHNLHVHLATYNVLTLRAHPGRDAEADADAAFMHKASYLAQQITAHKINIIGIQESRGSQSGVLQHDNVYRLIAQGTEQGTHGCELWFNLAQPIATIDGKPYYVEPDKLTVLFECPTVLLVRLQLPGLQLLVGTVHAPQSGAQSPYRIDWWRRLEEFLQSRREQDLVFIWETSMPHYQNQTTGRLATLRATEPIPTASA